MQSVSGNSSQVQEGPDAKDGPAGSDGKALEARLDSALTRLEQAAITATQPDPELLSELESLKGEVARLETENLKMRGAVSQADDKLGATVERLKAHLAS